MKLRHNDIKIPDDGTDSFVNCKLDRKKYAEVLTNILSDNNDGFVLAIDNKWGTGKSTFVKMWRQDLINKGYQTLYFNAWENDFQEEVIIALLSELEKFKEKGEQTFKTLLGKSATFLKKVAPAIVKGAASKAVGDEAISDVLGALTEFTTEEVELQIKTFNKKKKGINDFRISLEEFVDNVDNERPVVFIIDELDRCRPHYSVEVLEQIKHLFSVPGIVFVLSIDKVQLGNAVKGFYGSDLIDASEYLRRFIDLEYKIPRPNTEVFIEYLYNYFGFHSFLNETSRLQSRELKHENDNLKVISYLMFSKGFSLRQIEKAFARVRVTLRAFSVRQFLFPEILIFLSFLDVKHPDLLNKIRRYDYSLQELTDKLDVVFLLLANSDNMREIKYLLASFLYRYSNSIKTTSEQNVGLIDSSDPNKLKLKINSKLDDNNELIDAILYYKSRMNHTYNIKLEHILLKYDLTENLIS